MSGLKSLRKFAQSLPKKGYKMPVIFAGHGSPMNGIEDNIFSQYWKLLAEDIPRPSAVLVISAHWLTRGNTKITAMPSPRTIHDFMGFPQRLFDVRYPAPGHPQLARDMQEVVQQVPIEQDHEWGLDHGTWSIVRHMYPDANIPVLQLSIDFDKPAQFHYELAQELAVLRRQGVLIIGSGNMVHNLRMMDFSRLNTESYGFDWAIALNDIFKDRIANGDHQSLLEYEKLHEASRLAIPTPDHYFPLIYTLGLQNKKDQITFFNDRAVAGSITMTSVKFGD